MKTIDYLKKNGLLQLKTEFSIESTQKDDLLILNYSHIESPKYEEIVRECRCLVLDKEFNLVSRSFRRFFNLGECLEDYKKFHFPAICQEKVDGSLINVFYRDGWQICTRGSFGDGEINNSGVTWRELFLRTVNVDVLDKNLTYTFELCSTLNKVVRHYPEPKSYLLSVFNGELELNHQTVDNLAEEFNLNRPESVIINDTLDATRFVQERANLDKTFEGCVVRDHFNNRVKVKSEFYLQLHRSINNGCLRTVDIFRLILEGEADEFLSYFGEYRPKFEEMTNWLGDLRLRLHNFWFNNSEISSQKEYALKVMSDCKIGSTFLFEARKNKVHPFKTITAEKLDKIYDKS